MARQSLQQYLREILKPLVQDHKITPQKAAEYLLYAEGIAFDPQLGRRTSNRAFDNADNEIGATILGYTGSPLAGDLHEFPGDIDVSVNAKNGNRLENLLKLTNQWHNTMRAYDQREDNIAADNLQDQAEEDLQEQQPSYRSGLIS